MAKKQKLPSISVIKKTLYDNWALRVKQRDGFKCVLCGSEENLTSHHWYCCDHHAHAARYCIHNGVTLCYACHIRSVHTRADWLTVRKIETYFKSFWLDEYDENIGSILNLIKTELTVSTLRGLWDEFRNNPVCPADATVQNVRKKLYMYSPQRFVRYQTVVLDGSVYDIQVVTKNEHGGWRYTVKLHQKEEV